MPLDSLITQQSRWTWAEPKETEDKGEDSSETMQLKTAHPLGTALIAINQDILHKTAFKRRALEPPLQWENHGIKEPKPPKRKH